MDKDVSLIHVPFGLGAGQAGAEYGPESIMQAGLRERMLASGIHIADEVHIPCPTSTIPPLNPRAKYLPEVLDINRKLAEQMAVAMGKNHFPLVLGGDHSLAMGTLAGLTRVRNNVGVIWFDAHSDLNTVYTSPSGNLHGMSLAVSLGWTNWHFADARGNYRFIDPKHVVIIGARDLDIGEKAVIRQHGIACYTMHEIDRMGMEAVIQQALHIATAGTDHVHLSFDIDSVDPSEAPGTGTPVRGGVSYREAHFALELLSESGAVHSADFVEVNPTLDDAQKTSTLAMELICSLLGERILP